MLSEEHCLRQSRTPGLLAEMIKRSPFGYFKTSPEIIHLAVMLYIRYPLSVRKVEDLLHEQGVEISHKTVRYWCTGSARCSPRKFGIIGSWRCVQGGGTWLRS